MVVEIEAAQPWERGHNQPKDQSGRRARQRQDEPQASSGVAYRAGEMSIGIGVDDLKGMQRRMAKLYEEHSQAKASEQHIGSPAIQGMEPGKLQPALSSPTRSHESTRNRVLLAETAPSESMTMV